MTQDLSFTLPETEHCCDRGFHTFASLRYRFSLRKKEEMTRILSPPKLSLLCSIVRSLNGDARWKERVFSVFWLGAMETEQRRLLLCVCAALQKSDRIGMCLASSHCLRVCVCSFYMAQIHTAPSPLIQRSTHPLPLCLFN